MKKWFKRVVISVAVLAMVAVVGVAIFLLTFDPNAYKYKLEEAVQARYDRTLSIEGDIELSLFPRLGLNVQGVSLSEAGRPDEFASVDSARVAVAIWPLLFNKLVVDHVAINGFKARVVRDKAGRFNFRNLIEGGVPTSMSVESQAVRPGRPSAGQVAAGAAAEGVRAGAGAVVDASEAVRRTEMQIDIAGLDLREGEIILQDEQSGAAVRVVGLSANTGRVTFDQPFDMTVSARVEGGNPRVDARVTGQGLIKLDPAAMQYSAQRLDLRAEGQFPGMQAKALTARGNVAFDALIRSLDVSGLELAFQGDMPERNMAGVDASLAIPRLSVDPVRQHLKLEKLAVRAKGAMDAQPFELALDAPALQLSTEEAKGDAVTGRWRIDGDNALDANFNLAGLSGSVKSLDVQEVKLNLALKQGERLVKTTATSPVTLSVTEQSAAFTAMKGEVAITDPNLPKGSLQIPVIGSLSADLLKDQASAKINAVLEGGKFDLTATVTKLAEQPRIAFALAVDTLDLDKLAPPVSAPRPAPPQGSGDGSKEPAKAPEPPAKPASAPQEETPVDFSGLANVTANGTVKVGDLRVRGLKANSVSAAVKIENSRLDVSNLVAALYEGKLAGVLFLDANQGGQMGAKLSLAGISIDPLLTDVTGESSLSGRGSLALDLKTAGNTPTAWRRALGGSVQLRLRDGAVKGINVAQTLREFKAAIGGQRPTEMPADMARQTDFTQLDADLSFAKGVGTVRKLNLAAPVLRISQGDPATIDLVSGTLNLVANVRVVNTSTGQDGKGLEELRDVTIPVHVAGPFEKPAYSVLWSRVGSEALRRTLENRIREALTGGKDGQAPAGEAAPVPAKPEDAIKDIGKTLKGILGR